MRQFLVPSYCTLRWRSKVLQVCFGVRPKNETFLRTQLEAFTTKARRRYEMKRSYRESLAKAQRALVVFTFLFMSGFSSSALAHRFYWNPDSMTFETAFAYDTLPLSSFVIGELEPGETDFLKMPIPASTEAIVAVLAPQACADFLPELWIIAKTLPETEQAPFDIPEGYKSLKVTNEWQPYKDYIITARLGPNVRLALDETDYFLAVYAGEQSGNYIAIKLGRDTIGGTDEGFDALGRFVRCEKLLVEGAQE